MGESIVKITSLVDARNRLLFSQFLPLYERCFPDPNEREDPEQWENRLLGIQETPNDPKFFLLLIGENLLGEGGPPRVLGGITFEYFRHSKAGLLTYIAVDESKRKKGFAKVLLKNAFGVLQNEAARSGAPLSAVFGEANDIFKTAENMDSISPIERMGILARLGAKWIDLEYVQPSLRAGKKRVHNLLLLCFPSATGNSGTIRSISVKEFLEEFYHSLGVAELASDLDYRKMGRYLKGETLRLKELPELEKPLLHFKKAAICLHAVSLPDSELLSRDNELFDISARSKFKSFELDILSYRFQSSPPLISRCFKNDIREIWIQYPAQVEYESEGRCLSLIASEKNRVKKARAIMSQTFFPGSGIRVYHLTLQPVDEDHFSEYDLIKLTKLYGGTQEGNDLSQSIRFSFLDEQTGPYTITEFISTFLDGKTNKPLLLRAGTIEVDGESIDSSANVRKLLDIIRETFYGDSKCKEELSGLFKSSELNRSVLKALCGVITAIFDFGRMGFLEILDTFEPTVICGTGFIRIHRSNLVSFINEDDILQCCWNTIGISPYLIIPQAILIHNDALVDTAEDKMQSIMKPVGDKSKRLSRHDYQRWDRVRREAERHLKLDYIPNVFQYSTERQILDKGVQHRGSDKKEKIANDRLMELGSQIDHIHANRTQKADMTKSILLGFFTGMSLRPMIFALVEDWYGRVPSLNQKIAWFTFAFLFGCFFSFLIRAIRSTRRF